MRAYTSFGVCAALAVAVACSPGRGGDAPPHDAGPDGGHSADAGRDASPTDAGTDAGIDLGDPMGVIFCAAERCTADLAHVCCVNHAGDAGFAWACTPYPSCHGGDYGYQACDGPEDCLSGQICCAGSSLSGDTTLPYSQCAAPGICHSVFACHSEADCATGQHCCPRQSEGFTGSTCAASCT